MVINKYHHGNKIPPGAVNIMRGSPFGNPFQIGVDGDRDEVIEKYRQWLWGKLRSDTRFRDLVKGLYGKDLCCCCAPKPCHGFVLERAAAWLHEIESK